MYVCVCVCVTLTPGSPGLISKGGVMLYSEGLEALPLLGGGTNQEREALLGAQGETCLGW